MIKVYVDGFECEIDPATKVALKYDCRDMVDLERCREGQVLSFRMPLQGVNVELFKIAGDVHAESKFNSKGCKMVIEKDGVAIFDGSAYLAQVLWDGGKRYVVVECHGGALLWANIAAQMLLSGVDIDFEELLNMTTVIDSWSGDSPVKFFPIMRDRYEQTASSDDVMGVRVLRSIDDYHPFIRLSTLLEKIFDASGYTFESSLALREAFDELYISGNYSSARNDAAREAMSFYAKRLADGTTTASTMGMVSMSAYEVVNNVGLIVDLESIADDRECYNYGNVLQIDDKALVFRPLTQISVGFEYFLHYTCECEIASRTKMRGIDTINLIDEGSIGWEITNRYIDQRDSYSTQVEYSLCIFDFEAGQEYALFGRGGTSITHIMNVDSRFTTIMIGEEYDEIVLYEVVSGVNKPCEGDWALYFGFVEERSTVEVKVTVRSAPHQYSPIAPMEFDYIRLEGAAPGAEFTLHRDTSVRPYFAAYPGYGSTITFEDVAQQPFSALELLQALQHMYNLRFSTNEAAKVVTVEDFAGFYLDEEFDWSAKIIAGEPIEFSDIALNKHRHNTLGYQQTDGVVQRMGQSDNKYFGEWSYEVDSYGASSSHKTDLNPIFCASTNDEDGALMVGNRDDIETVNSLSFSPRIVRLLEMREVDRENYLLPYAAFHDPESGYSLCFEDRDGVRGLNRFYQSEIELYSRAQLISLSLRLSACDYTNLFAPSEGSASLRSRFYFDLWGESFRAILHSIESYDPESGVARCLFLTID